MRRACSTVGITDTTLMFQAAHDGLAWIGPAGGDDRDAELDAGRRAALGDAAAHGHDVDAERLAGTLPYAGDVGAQLLVGAAEGRQQAEPTRLAHRRHQLDTAAALHGTLQDRVPYSQQVADDGVEHVTWPWCP
jgi:hypothetical protein